MHTLLTTTVHTATDYGAAAWMGLDVPDYFANQQSIIDNSCARSALGALKSTPTVFLEHDLNLTKPTIRLQMKILSFIAKTLTKPERHPLHKFASSARAAKMRCHHSIFHRFFQSDLCLTFDDYTRQKTIDTAIRLSKPPNFSTVIQKGEQLAKSGAKALKHSPQHLLIFTDGSRLPDKGAGAAAWCANSNTSISEHLGPARSHGIFEVEYHGLHLGLTLALRHASVRTRVATVLLDNQSVTLDIRSQKHSLESLIDKQRTYTILNYLHRSFPSLRLVIRWCPGHTGIQGNEKVDKLAKKAAIKKSSEEEGRETGISAFLSVIKEWGKANTRLLSERDRARLGHDHQSHKHLRALSSLPKHSVATLTQLRSNHAPLNHYLFRMGQVPEPVCKCQTGIETPEHFLFICPSHTAHRSAFLNKLTSADLPHDTSILRTPNAFKHVATYCDATWRFKNRWVWANIRDEPVPTHLSAPSE